MSRVNAAALPTTSGKCPAGTVPLEHPITSFAIPSVLAECVFPERETLVVFGVPEEIDVVHPETKETYPTCRVAVSVNKALVGYIPLPLRYQATWLELSYCIVLYTQMWELWAAEEENTTKKTQKDKCATLHKNSGVVVAQHKLTRLLAVEELLSLSLEASLPGKESVRILDEWRIRWCRDWFTSTYNQVVNSGVTFLNTDPIRPENCAFFETGWSINETNKHLVYPPDDLAKWFNGEVDGLEDQFDETLKSEALASLKKHDAYTDCQFNSNARLPVRWHEGQKPWPHFWSVEQWDWIAEGNSMWEKPTELLFYAVKVKPELTFHEFKCLLDSLLTNLRVCSNPTSVYTLATKLWMGEKTWRKFAKELLIIHLCRPSDAIPLAWETIDPANPFNTVEARLVLQGYMSRLDSVPAEQWDEEDGTLWNCLSSITLPKYELGWTWIIHEVTAGKALQDLLDMAGGWWSEREKRSAAKAKDTSRNEREAGGAADKDTGASEEDHRMDGDENADRSDASGKAAAGADGGADVSQQITGASEDDHIMGDVENDGAGQQASPGKAAAHNASAGSSTTAPPQPPHDRLTEEFAPNGWWKILQQSPNLMKIVRQFTAFLEHRDIDQLELALAAGLPSSCNASITEFLTHMDVWLDSGDTNPPFDLAWVFFNREMTVRAREEAIEEQDQLL